MKPPSLTCLYLLQQDMTVSEEFAVVAMVVTWRWLLIEAFVVAARKQVWKWPAVVIVIEGFEFVAAARLVKEH